MLKVRSLHGAAAIVGLLVACVSDSGSILKPTEDGGTQSDTGASSTSSSSSSGGEDAKTDAPPIVPLFGCKLDDPGRAILHLDQANAVVIGQQVARWPNLVGQHEDGIAQGDVGGIIRDKRFGIPSIKFDNRRVGTSLPDRRIEFRGMKGISGSFALFVYGGHDFDSGSTEFDASAVGATYLHSASGANRLQLMGQYHHSENGFDAFGVR